MWGQVDRHTCYLCCQRIIPTRVGTRLTKNGYLSDEFDHPHACGDKTVSAVPLLISILSSPRVWGQDRFHSGLNCFLWIIPTRVGTRHYPANLSKTAGDHPHACGDKSSLSFLAKEEQGSSPRVWGQAACDLLHYAYAGIIPTRVGTSAVCRSYFTS